MCLEIALSSGDVCHEGSPLQSSFSHFQKILKQYMMGWLADSSTSNSRAATLMQGYSATFAKNCRCFRPTTSCRFVLGHELLRCIWSNISNSFQMHFRHFLRL